MIKNTYIPDRGDVVWLVLNPRTGREQSGRRPALVLSPKLFSQHTGLAVICPITTRVKGLPFEIKINGDKVEGAILPIHVRSVDIESRRVRFIEKSSTRTLNRVTQAVEAIIGVNQA